MRADRAPRSARRPRRTDPVGGRVTIDVHEQDRGGLPGAAILVADTGPGIAPQDQARVFERFFRADPARGAGGAGLGLAIARRIVEAHVVLKPGIPGDAACAKRLQDHVKATIAPYKYPRSLKFTAALPKTETGKVQRFKLKRQ